MSGRKTGRAGDGNHAHPTGDTEHQRAAGRGTEKVSARSLEPAGARRPSASALSSLPVQAPRLRRLRAAPELGGRPHGGQRCRGGRSRRPARRSTPAVQLTATLPTWHAHKRGDRVVSRPRQGAAVQGIPAADGADGGGAGRSEVLLAEKASPSTALCGPSEAERRLCWVGVGVVAGRSAGALGRSFLPLDSGASPWACSVCGTCGAPSLGRALFRAHVGYVRGPLGFIEATPLAKQGPSLLETVGSCMPGMACRHSGTVQPPRPSGGSSPRLVPGTPSSPRGAAGAPAADLDVH